MSFGSDQIQIKIKIEQKDRESILENLKSSEFKLNDLKQKNDFAGKDALIHIKRNGVERKFTGFFLDGPNLNKPNEHRLRLLQS